MMRRLFLIGALMALPVLAEASPGCEALSQSVDPISRHYVKKVLDRADAGIAYANEALENDDFFPFYLPIWAQKIGGTMAQIVDSRQTLTVRETDLDAATACLRYDQIILECKMDEVRRALDAQLERGSFFGIMQLQSLMLFLQERLAALSEGAADGTYADAGWERQRLFDREPPEELTEPLCPFHSDYTPARMTGYGCDVSVLSRIAGNGGDLFSFAQAELDGLASIENEIERFREIIPLLQGATGDENVRLVVTIMTTRDARNGAPGQAEYLRESESTKTRLSNAASTSWPPAVVEASDWGRTFDELSPTAERGGALIDWGELRQAFEEYKQNIPTLKSQQQIGGEIVVVASYLFDPTNRYADDPNRAYGPFFGIQAYTPSSGSAESNHKTLVGCIEELGTCSGDSSLACGSTEFCASRGAGTCSRDVSSPTIPKRALRGPFTYVPDHLRLLTDFMEKRIDDGLSRTYPQAWSRTEDLPPGSDEAAERETFDSPALAAGRTTLRSYFRSISGMQGRREGAIFPEATDSQLEIAESLSDMRAAIGELSRLASQKDGVRAFIAEFAYFLRRTCIFRPCQQSLEQVIRIALQDVCFPYTNGDFLSDSADSPRWKICAVAACVRVDDENGTPVELPESCDDILP